MCVRPALIPVKSPSFHMFVFNLGQCAPPLSIAMLSSPALLQVRMKAMFRHAQVVST